MPVVGWHAPSKTHGARSGSAGAQCAVALARQWAWGRGAGGGGGVAAGFPGKPGAAGRFATPRRVSALELLRTEKSPIIENDPIVDRNCDLGRFKL
jgi:hypothetical protein